MSRQFQVVEQFDRMWRRRYPCVVSTLGRRLRPEKVEKALGVQLARMPVTDGDFAMWYFRSPADARKFITSLPLLDHR